MHLVVEVFQDKRGALLFAPCSHKKAIAHMLPHMLASKTKFEIKYDWAKVPLYKGDIGHGQCTV